MQQIIEEGLEIEIEDWRKALQIIFDEQAKAELKKLHFSNYINCNKCNLKLIGKIISLYNQILLEQKLLR